MDATVVAVAMGLETTVNDPFVVRRGPRLEGVIRPLKWLGAGVAGSAYPVLGQLDWTAATFVLIEENEVAPDVSRIVGQGLVFAELTPLSGAQDRFGWALRLTVGSGAVATVDDLELVTMQGQPEAEQHRSETHPVWGYGVSAESSIDQWGLRARWARTHYVERVAAVEEDKAPMWVGVDVVLRLGAPPPPPAEG